MSFFSLYELFLDFICADNNTESLVISLFGVNIFIPFSSFTSSSSLSSSGMDDISSISSSCFSVKSADFSSS